MEKLFTLPAYMRHPDTKQFNPKLITQLIENYRSHEYILHVANHLFYDGKLVPKGPKDITDWFVNSDFLPNNIPIMFQAVFGYSTQSENTCRYVGKLVVYLVVNFTLPSNTFF